MNTRRVRGALIAPLARYAWAALLVLGLGGAGHFWHHLSDPDCESPVRGSTHACSVCAAFHGGVLAGQSQVAVAPPPSAPARLSLPPTDTGVIRVAPVGPARGPPST